MKNYLPKTLVEEMVGAHVTSIVEVWERMDKRYGDPLMVALLG